MRILGFHGAKSHLSKEKERPSHSFFPSRYDLASGGCFLMRAVTDIWVFPCAGWLRSSGERETAKTSGRNHYETGM